MNILNTLIPVVSAGWAPADGVVTDPNKLVSQVIDLVLLFVVIAAVLFIMFAGVQYVTSSGDAAKAKQAMASITNAIIGLVVAFAAYVLVKLVVNRLGIQLETTISSEVAAPS